MLKIRLFGTLDVVRGEEGERLESLLGQPKRLALLTILADRQLAGPVRREQLLALLWPERAPSKGRHALNTTLTRLREVLGSDVLRGRHEETLWLSPDHVRSDVCEFQRALQEDRPADVVETYRGPFLQGFRLPEGREYEEWAEKRRQRYEQQAYRATLKAAAESREAGDLEEAEAAYRRALEIRPLREDALTGLLRVLAQRGNRTAALRRYSHFRERLDKELGTVPSAELKEVVEQIRSEAGSTTSSGSPSDTIGSGIAHLHSSSDAGAAGKAVPAARPAAYDLHRLGKYYWYHRFRFGLEAALECFEQAIEIDDEYAAPYTGLADIHTVTALYRLAPPNRVREAARSAIDRALALDSELADAWHSEGLFRAFFNADWSGALSAFRRATELNPTSARHRMWIGFLGRFQTDSPDDVDEQLSRAEELAPRSDYVLAVLGLAAVLDRRYSDVVRLGNQATEIESQAFFPWLTKGFGLLHQGDAEAGLSAMEEAAELAERTPFVLGVLGSAFALVGKTDRTRAILRELEARTEEEFVAPIFFGMLNGALGETESALDSLREEIEMYNAGSFALLAGHIWPELDREPEYRGMLQDVGLDLPPSQLAVESVAD